MLISYLKRQFKDFLITTAFFTIPAVLIIKTLAHFFEVDLGKDLGVTLLAFCSWMISPLAYSFAFVIRDHFLPKSPPKK